MIFFPYCLINYLFHHKSTTLVYVYPILQSYGYLHAQTISDGGMKNYDYSYSRHVKSLTDTLISFYESARFNSLATCVASEIFVY